MYIKDLLVLFLSSLLLTHRVFAQVATEQSATTSSTTATTTTTGGVTARLGNIDVPVTVEGSAFTLSFAPELVTARDMATKLCTEQGSALGITQETLPNCVEQVGRYVQSAVDRWLSQRTLQVPVIVNGTRFDVSFLPERDNVLELATRLCAAEQLALNEESRPLCAEGVAQYLRRRTADWLDEKTLYTTVTIEDLPFEVRFLPERQSPEEMAERLCRGYADSLKVTGETLAPCVNAVGQALTARVQDWVRSKTLTTSVDINNQALPLSFLPERDSVQSVARRVCLDQAQTLQLTEENFASVCYDPLVNFLNQQVQVWLESRRVLLPLSIAGEDLTVAYLPLRQTPFSVAERICVDRAGRLNLTNENIVADCINPVSKVLSDGLLAWRNKQTEAAAANAQPQQP